MLALIRVFTTDDKELRNNHAHKITAAYKIPIKTYCIPNQYYGIHDDATEKLAVPKIIHTALQAEAAGATGIIISCAADPGVAETRASLRIPVIGAGSAAAGIALSLGKRVGVLNLAGRTAPRIAALLGDQLAAETAPRGVSNTTDLLTPAGQKAALAAALKLEEECDVIMFGCTGYTTIGLRDKLKSSIRIPIVDAIEAAGAVAFYQHTTY